MVYGLIKLSQTQQELAGLIPTYFDKMAVSEKINFDGMGTIEGYLMKNMGIIGTFPVGGAGIEIYVDNEINPRARVPTDAKGYFRVEVPGINLAIGIHAITVKYPAPITDILHRESIYTTHITVLPTPADPMNPYNEPSSDIPNLITGWWKKYQPWFIFGGVVIVGGYIINKVYTTKEYRALAEKLGKKTKESYVKATPYIKKGITKLEEKLKQTASQLSAAMGED